MENFILLNVADFRGAYTVSIILNREAVQFYVLTHLWNPSKHKQAVQTYHSNRMPIRRALAE